MKNSRRHAKGFTLTELVVVIVIASILAAVVYSRVSVSEFKVEGSTDELKAALRYAHKLAIAQRRNVFVSASGSDVSLCYVNGCASRVTKPPTADPFTVTPSNTPTLSSAFYFDAQGRPTLIGGALATGAITLSIAGATRVISVEPQTGFVH
jgi:prepilin-type N-terminal cleavage/methylation domain-containing protein